MTDPIADMLTRIRNAIMVRKEHVVVPFSNVKHAIAVTLEREGFITKFEKVEQKDQKRPVLKLELKYKQGESVIRGIKRISSPGMRVYYGYKQIPKLLSSLGVMIVSTSHGMMTNEQARQQKLGGEIICEIY